MPNYAVDGMRQAMTATGIVEPSMEWEETPEGKKRPSKDKQARDENTGMPLWNVEVLYVTESFGRRSTVAARVTVGHEQEPQISPMTPIGFHGLRVEVRTNKAGGFAEYWNAEALMDTSKGQAQGSREGKSAEAGKAAA